MLSMNKPQSLRNTYKGMLSGAMVGVLLGLVIDHFLTRYVLLNYDDPAIVIITNATSAFIIVPVVLVIFTYVGYRRSKRGT